MKMPSQSENLAIIREAVSKIAAQAGFDTDDVSKIELAVDEACANVIKHAYDKGNSKKLIEVLIKIDKNKLMVVVTDKGKGFNPSDIKLPKMREYLKEMRVGGLGIYLIETLMDKVNFDLKPGIKNQVKMIKYINKKSANSTNLPN
jgi:serine/threonine-protein kinase RsbW